MKREWSTSCSVNSPGAETVLLMLRYKMDARLFANFLCTSASLQRGKVLLPVEKGMDLPPQAAAKPNDLNFFLLVSYRNLQMSLQSNWQLLRSQHAWEHIIVCTNNRIYIYCARAAWCVRSDSFWKCFLSRWKFNDEMSAELLSAKQCNSVTRVK